MMMVFFSFIFFIHWYKIDKKNNNNNNAAIPIHSVFLLAAVSFIPFDSTRKFFLLTQSQMVFPSFLFYSLLIIYFCSAFVLRTASECFIFILVPFAIIRYSFFVDNSNKVQKNKKKNKQKHKHCTRVLRPLMHNTQINKQKENNRIRFLLYLYLPFSLSLRAYFISSTSQNNSKRVVNCVMQ